MHTLRTTNIRMAGGRDEVEQGMHSVIPETRVTPDPGLFSEDIVILAFKVSDNLLEAGKRIELVTAA